MATMSNASAKTSNESADYTELMQLCASGTLEEVKKSLGVNSSDLAATPPQADPSVLNAVAGWNQSTALMIAAQAGKDDIVQFLLNQNNIDYAMTNNLGCNALMLAAEYGHKKIVEMLSKHDLQILKPKTAEEFKKQLIRGRTIYEQTALMLAIENTSQGDKSRWLGVITYIIIDLGIDECRWQLEARNQFDKWPFMIACEFGQLEVVKWFLEHVVDSLDSDGAIRHKMIHGINKKHNSCLMMACTGDPLDSRGSKIVRMLLKENIDVNVRNFFGDNALHYAIAKFNPAFTDRHIAIAAKKFEAILEYMPSDATLTQFNGQGLSPLMRACEFGQDKAVELLLKNEHVKKRIWDVNVKSIGRETAFHYAFMNGHIALCTKFLMREEENGSVFRDMFNLKAKDVFTPQQLTEMAKRFSIVNRTDLFNDRSRDAMAVLGKYAAVYEFHLDLLLTLIPLAPSCIAMLNKTWSYFVAALREGVPSPFEPQKIINMTHADLVFKLVRLCAALKLAMSTHPMERADIQERLTKVEKTIHSIFRDCENMDEVDNVKRTLCSAMRHMNKSFTNQSVDRAMCFRVGPVPYALDYGISTLFASANVSTFIDRIFWSSLKMHDYNWIEAISYKYRERLKGLDSHWLVKAIPKEAENIFKLKSNLISGRYSPAFMFFADAVSHTVTFFLICWVVLVDDELSDRSSLRLSEGFLILMCLSSILVEIGLLIGDGIETQILMHYQRYFSDVWNYFDLCSLSLIVVWLIVKYSPSQPYEYSKAALASATIFHATGLLRYSSFNESFGQFVILIIETVLNLGAFVLVFLFSILGFWIFFFALFSDNHFFATPPITFLTMFSAALGNYATFSDIFGDEGILTEIGMAGWLAYVSLSAIVLVNLIIAHMNSTYKHIYATAFQKWQLARTSTVAQFLLIHEKNSLCMLPAPFNILTILLSPVQYVLTVQKLSDLRVYTDEREKLQDILKDPSSKPASKIETEKLIRDCRRKYKGNRYYFSIPGTFADIICGLLASFVGPLVELFGYIYQVFVTIDVRNAEPFTFLKMLLIVLFFPCIYPFYVVSLILETFYHNRTVVALEECEHGYLKLIVRYERRRNCEIPKVEPHKTIENGEIWIKVIRGKFDKFRANSTAHVRVRIGEYEKETGPALYPGQDCVWSQEVLKFPIKSELSLLLNTEIHTNQFMEMTVVDRDPVTREERVVGYRQGGSKFRLQEWIANKRFEGQLDFYEDGLDGLKGAEKVGFLALYVKIQYDTESYVKTKESMSDELIANTSTRRLSRYDSRAMRHAALSFRASSASRSSWSFSWVLTSKIHALKDKDQTKSIETSTTDKPVFQREYEYMDQDVEIFSKSEQMKIFALLTKLDKHYESSENKEESTQKTAIVTNLKDNNDNAEVNR